jgi:hypothetical protein
MKPIAQSFLVSQPDTSIDGVFLSKIDVYFKAVSSTYGITMEIRTVDNGFPTPNVIAGGRSRLSSADVTSSDTATTTTSFLFDSLPFLQTNTQYAFVLIPDGGNDEYLVWTSKLGQKDVATQTDIYTNNQLGSLFISSNDLVFTPVIDESMKYDMYAASFTATSANVYFRPINTEFLKINNAVGTFLNQETVWVSNSTYTYAQTVTNSTTVMVPNSSIADLTVNNWIYLTTSDRTSINFRRVASAVNSTAITISSNANFTNTTCTFGRIRGDGQLFATIKSKLQFSDQEEVELVLTNPTSNSTLNFATSANQYIFGLSSNASANISSVANKQYDSLTPQINYIAPAQTAIDFSYSGYSNSGVVDSSYMTTQVNIPNEFIDTERKVYSRSNALVGAPGSNSTLLIRADLSTSNNLTAPYIDRLGTSVVLTYNSPTAQTQLLGYHLNLTGISGKFLVGETITQGSNTAVVDGANNTYIRVNSPNGSFSNTTITGGTSGATANVTVSTYFDETLENGYYGASRYISKNVILADKQDAEDLITYLTIYRPVGTQFLVYGKFLNGSDTDSFSSKDWSYMPELDATTALFSSPVNRDDVIEAQFGLPSSIMIDPNGAVTSTSIANVTVLNSAYYTSNTYVYLKDVTPGSTGTFNIRKVVAASNNTLTLSSVPSFSSSNVTVGTIPNLQSQSGAFLYANNNNIVRYVTNTDVVYDSYKNFAVKIVPVSNNSILVPIMKNMRALALQV